MDTMENIFDEEMRQPQVTETVTAVRRPWLDWSVGGTEYHLKLTTSIIRKMEQQFKKSLLDAVLSEGIPPVSTVIIMLQGALQKYHHGITSEKVEVLMDTYLDEGGTLITLLQNVIYPLMHDAGFLTDAMLATITSTMDDIDAQL